MAHLIYIHPLLAELAGGGEFSPFGGLSLKSRCVHSACLLTMVAYAVLVGAEGVRVYPGPRGAVNHG